MSRNNELLNKIKSFNKKNSAEIRQAFIALIIALLLGALMIFIGKIADIDLFGGFSSYLQYFTVILALFAWYNTKKLLADREKQHVVASSKDLILTIGLSREVESDVKIYLSSLTGGDAVLANLKKLKLSGENKTDEVGVTLTPNNSYMNLEVNGSINGALSIKKIKDMPEPEEEVADYIGELQRCIAKVMDIMSENANDKLHVFIAAPVEIGAYVTPFFTNKKTVIMYRYVKDLDTKYVKMEPVRDRINP